MKSGNARDKAHLQEPGCKQFIVKISKNIMNATVKELTTQIGSDQEHIYVIPIYQRTYTWGKKIDKLKDFLSIIGNAFEQSDNVANRFIGFMVTVTPESGGTIGRKEFIVVDGQQRITTISLIICALINRLNKAGLNAPDGSEAKQFLEATAERYLHKYIVLENHSRVKQGRLTLEHLRFLPSKPDRESYLKIANNQTPATPSAVGQAYEEINKYLDALERKYPATEQFEERVIKVLRTLTIVLLEIDRQKPGEAQSIFESINYRNAPLSPYDLIRNRVFMYQNGTEGDDIFKDIWEPMENRYRDCFSASGADESKVPDHERELLMFFSAYLQQDGTKVPKADIYSKFLERIAPESARKPGKDEVKTYAEASRLYLFFKKSEWAVSAQNAFGPHFEFYSTLDVKGKQKVRRNLQALSFLDIQSTIPFLMGMVNLGASGKEIIEATDFFIALFIRIRFSGGGTQRIGGQISNLTKSLNEKKMEVLRSKGVKTWMHDNLTSDGEPVFPSDSAVEAYLKVNGAYKDNASYIKYVLHELCRGDYGDGGIANYWVHELDEKITIDHVLCQNRSKAWIEYQKNNGDPIDQPTFDKYIHLIGNLALAYKNSQWRDSVYDEVYDDNGSTKAGDMLSKSHHLTTSEIPRDYAKLDPETKKWGPWGYSQITSRTDSLIRRILDQWKI